MFPAVCVRKDRSSLPLCTSQGPSIEEHQEGARKRKRKREEGKKRKKDQENNVTILNNYSERQ
jgi:hypothetical protein